MAAREVNYLKNKRAKEVADRTARDERYKDVAGYKSQVFPWEKVGYNPISNAPISKKVLKADPSIVTATNPRVLSPTQIQSNIDKSDPTKRAASVSNALGQVSDAAAQRKLVNTDSPVSTGDVSGSSSTTIRDDINTSKRNLIKERFKAQLTSGNKAFDREKEALIPAAREEERQLRTSDTLAREGTRKLAAPLGLSASGSTLQSDIAQNVATGEVRGANKARLSEQRANIEARRTELESLVAQGLATAETNMELAELEAQLRQSDLDEQREYEQGLLENERSYTERQNTTTREENAFEQEKTDFINTIGRFRPNIAAEINNIMEDGDPSNDWKIPILEAYKQNKIAEDNLDQEGNPLPVDPTPDLTSSSAISLWDQLGTANEAISRALGVPVGTRFTRRAASNVKSDALTQSQLTTNARWMVTNGIPLTGDFAKSINLPEGYVDPNFVGVAEGEEEDGQILDDAMINSIDDLDDNTKQILETLINQPNIYNNDGARLAEILKDRKISDKMVDIYEAWRESSLNNNILDNNTFQ